MNQGYIEKLITETCQTIINMIVKAKQEKLSGIERTSFPYYVVYHLCESLMGETIEVGRKHFLKEFIEKLMLPLIKEYSEKSNEGLN